MYKDNVNVCIYCKLESFVKYKQQQPCFGFNLLIFDFRKHWGEIMRYNYSLITVSIMLSV